MSWEPTVLCSTPLQVYCPVGGGVQDSKESARDDWRARKRVGLDGAPIGVANATPLIMYSTRIGVSLVVASQLYS